MKKILLIVALFITSAFAASAANNELSIQGAPKAIGLRLGYGADISYWHNLDEDNFIEANLGLPGFSGIGLNLNATYNYVLGKYNWTPGLWTFYAGYGANVGFEANKEHGSIFRIGVMAKIGLAYEFDEVPIQLSVDMAPIIGIQIGSAIGGVAYDDEFGSLVPRIGVRYCF